MQIPNQSNSDKQLFIINSFPILPEMKSERVSINEPGPLSGLHQKRAVFTVRHRSKPVDSKKLEKPDVIM
jgi:hypothetical protein